MEMPSDANAAPDRSCVCPVCRATQSPRDLCRRCGADLALMIRAAESGQAARRRLERAVAAGDEASAARLRDYLSWLEG